MQTRTIKSSSLTLWARLDGNPNDPPVLLIAGANASHLMWPDEFVSLLTGRGYCVIRYDHRDTGRSTAADFEKEPYTVEDLGDDAIHILDGFGFAKAHVVGLSLGGTIVQVLLIDHSSRLISAVIMMTAALDVDFVGNIGRAYSGEPEPQGLPLPNKEVLDQLSRRSRVVTSDDEELDRRTQEWVALSGKQARVDPSEFREWERRSILHTGHRDQPSNHARAAPVSIDRGSELSRVTTPTLVIQGGQDPLNPPPHGQHIADLILGARLREITSLGHSLPSSQHGVIVDALVEHFQTSAHGAPLE